MKRIATVSVLLLTAHLWVSGAIPDVLKDNRYVQVEVTVAAQAMKADGSGELRIAFAPAEGIHITATPAVEFQPDSACVFVKKGRAAQHPDTITGFLSTGTPVLQAFGVAAGTPPGRHVLRGSVVYFYCSDTEGWCMRYRQRIELPITITD